MDKMPKWADVVLVPVVSLILAALISIIVFLAVGQNPWEALKLMAYGAVGTSDSLGYTLFYTTNFIFTGLAVAVAFHASLFNIGGEGQVLLGGLGAAIVCLFVPWPHWTLALIGGGLAAAAFGALWVVIPAYLQARRGSHIVITTIMFNFMAAGLLVYMLSDALRPDGQMQTATDIFPDATHLPSLNDIAGLFGSELFGRSPVNISIFIALAACGCVAFDLAHAVGLSNPCLWPIGKRCKICRYFRRKHHYDRLAHFRRIGGHDGGKQHDGHQHTTIG